MPALLPDARDLLAAFSYIAIDDDVVDGAMNEPDRGLRSPDAIHLATARIMGSDLSAIVSYDDPCSRQQPMPALPPSRLATSQQTATTSSIFQATKTRTVLSGPQD